jgi:uncharacterized protein
MLEVIEKLLILQDRDRKILRVRNQLAYIQPERQSLVSKAERAQAALENAALRLKQLESDRKQLELDVEAKRQQIEKYSIQQFQTKKNEEFRALAKEIETCKGIITGLDDQQIELMEQAELVQKEVHAATQAAKEAKKLTDGQLANLEDREKNLKKELAELEATRLDLTAGIDESTLSRYERLLKNKGESVVVGISHAVCGGCHMGFPTQLVLACKAQQELVTCPNCGRILYYTRDMDLAVAE